MDPWNIQSLAQRFPYCPDVCVKAQDASAGNRTRVTSMATMYSTTRPLMLMLIQMPVAHLHDLQIAIASARARMCTHAPAMVELIHCH